MIYAIPKDYPSLCVPRAAFMACVQPALIGVHDSGSRPAREPTGATMLPISGATEQTF
jgi:hypothetical protein